MKNDWLPLIGIALLIAIVMAWVWYVTGGNL
jgi:hypothetical protein